jgi:hypothetical protein
VASDRTPITPEAFAAAVDSVDRDALAGFVGRLEAAADATASVEVDPPTVAVDDGDGGTRLFVAPPDGTTPDLPEDPAPDVVVIGSGRRPTWADGAAVRTPADLRRQLLYAVSPEAAESIAEEWLGVPARAASYTPEPTPPPDSHGSTASADGNTSDSGSGSEESGGTAAPETRDTEGAEAAGADDADEPRPGSAPRTHADPTDGSGVPATHSAAGLAVVAVLVAMILAVAGGVVYAAEVAPDGDAGAFAAAAPAPSTDGGLSEAEIRRRSRAPIDDSGAITGDSTASPGGAASLRPLDGPNDTEANRNVRPVPTCERSFLAVVQLQMNALKYNNDTTNDGIRTVRRFASPQNRQTIRSFDEFARIIKSPTYSPMLSYDSAQFTPIQSSDDYAQVQVLTREDGNVTGKYYFRLRKAESGGYDGCWTTDAVVSVPETTNFSGRVAGESTGTTGTA